MCGVRISARCWLARTIEYGIFGEGSQVSTNQKRKCTVLTLLIGWNLRPFPENTVLYYILYGI